MAFAADDAAVGFAELSIRNIVDSCATDRVGYLEGCMSTRSAARASAGRFVRAAEHLGGSEGCTELASDPLIDNDALAARRSAVALGRRDRSGAGLIGRTVPTPGFLLLLL
jgi:hypothetical protein